MMVKQLSILQMVNQLQLIVQVRRYISFEIDFLLIFFFPVIFDEGKPNLFRNNSLETTDGIVCSPDLQVVDGIYTVRFFGHVFIWEIKFYFILGWSGCQSL